MVKDNEQELSNYRALVDTSSVVAHDICAQLHVLQFCAEELEEFVKEGGGPYLEKLHQSAHYLNNLLNSFRKQLKISFDPTKDYQFSEIQEGVTELIKNHYYGVMEHLIFESDFEDHYQVKGKANEFMHLVYSAYSFLIDAIAEENAFEGKPVIFRARNERLNSRFFKFTLRTIGPTISEKDFEDSLAKDIPEKGKMRKYIGLSLLKQFQKLDPEFFKYESLEEGNLISFKLPRPQVEN